MRRFEVIAVDQPDSYALRWRLWSDQPFANGSHLSAVRYATESVAHRARYRAVLREQDAKQPSGGTRA